MSTREKTKHDENQPLHSSIGPHGDVCGEMAGDSRFLERGHAHAALSGGGDFRADPENPHILCSRHARPANRETPPHRRENAAPHGHPRRLRLQPDDQQPRWRGDFPSQRPLPAAALKKNNRATTGPSRKRPFSYSRQGSFPNPMRLGLPSAVPLEKIHASSVEENLP